MRTITILIILSVVSSVAFATPELKGNPDELRQFLHLEDKVVTIHGQADEKAYSDKAIVSLVITTEDELLSNAISMNSTLRDSIAKQLMATGISSENIKTSKFSTSPQYGWFGKKPDSYKVVNRMAVSINDESQLKDVAVVSDEKKEVELLDTTFEYTEKDEYTNKVKIKALENVMKQKKFYESSLGVKLTPIGFRDTSIGHRTTLGARDLEEVVVTASKRFRGKQEAPMSVITKRDVQDSSFDEIQYEAEIYVDFKIDTSRK